MTHLNKSYTFSIIGAITTLVLGAIFSVPSIVAATAQPTLTATPTFSTATISSRTLTAAVVNVTKTAQLIAATETAQVVQAGRTATMLAIQEIRTSTAIAVKQTRTQQSIDRTATPAAATATSAASTQTFLDLYQPVGASELSQVFNQSAKQAVVIKGMLLNVLSITLSDEQANSSGPGYLLLVSVDAVDSKISWSLHFGQTGVTEMSNDSVVIVVMKERPNIYSGDLITAYGNSQQDKLSVGVTMSGLGDITLKAWCMSGDVVERTTP